MIANDRKNPISATYKTRSQYKPAKSEHHKTVLAILATLLPFVLWAALAL